MNPPQPWRTFSIFISSTFADMQSERDHLKTFIFPKVEEELYKKKDCFGDCGFAVGVDTVSVNEGDREATMLKVCLDEIKQQPRDSNVSSSKSNINLIRYIGNGLFKNILTQALTES